MLPFPIASFFFAKVPPIHFEAGKLHQLVPLPQSFNSQTILLVTGGKSLAVASKLAEIHDMSRYA